MSEEIQSRLIEGCKNEDPVFQRELVNRYSDYLYAVCLRYTGDTSRADDALQESFIRIFKYFKSFSPLKGELSTWMRQITVNASLKFLKKHKHLNQLSLEMNDHPSIEPQAIAKMNADELLFVISDLPDGYREVFNLIVIEGYSYKEVSDMLNIKEVSCRSSLSRAKKILKTKLSKNKSIQSCTRII